MGSRGYPLPADEPGRLQALRALECVGTGPEVEFDSIVELLSTIFHVPIALLSLMEEDHQWFKARVGIDLETTDRCSAFCAHTITGNDVFVVSDATQDRRFADNPLVRGEPNIRFYAGYPLSLDGRHNIGSLCIIDTFPRQPTPVQLEQLTHLAKVAEGLLRGHQRKVLIRLAEDKARKQHLELTEQHQLLQQVEQMAGLGAFKVDRDTGETYWSDQLFRLHGLPIGTPPTLREALHHFPANERKRVLTQIKADFKTKCSTLVETDFITAQGRKRRVRVTGDLTDAADGSTLIHGVMQDITTQHENAQSLWRAAHFDNLSGLANRESFNRHLEEELGRATRAQKGVALVLIDLDGFKLINDSLGHAAGDRVIQVVAERMRDLAGDDAFCARLAGDEFAILKRVDHDGGEPLVELRQFADAMIARLKRPLFYNEDKVYVGASIGMACAPQDSNEPDGLLRCADMALYKAKRSGRGMALFYNDGLKHIFNERRSAVNSVREAHLAGRIEAYYQPIVDIRSRQRIGAEALVRIRTSDGALIGPDDFGAAFEDPESARTIDRSVSQCVFRDLASWHADGRDPGIISINISEYWFQIENFARRTRAALAEAGLDPASIRLEIGENMLVNEDAGAFKVELRKLMDAGMSIALDDFGAGFASLTHIRDYPLDTIKIDRSFIGGLCSQRQQRLIVRAIVDLSHSLDLTVIATGVETEAEAEYLAEIGCFLAQGTLFQDAVARDRLLR